MIKTIVLSPGVPRPRALGLVRKELSVRRVHDFLGTRRGPRDEFIRLALDSPVLESGEEASGTHAMAYAVVLRRNQYYAQAAMRDTLLRGEAPYGPYVPEYSVGIDMQLQIDAKWAWKEVADREIWYTDIGGPDLLDVPGREYRSLQAEARQWYCDRVPTALWWES